MSQDRVRLLSHIVYQHFGSAVGEIATLLLVRGALSFAQLARLSSLPPALIHKCLAVLSLHSLLYHSETDSWQRITVLYEINEVNVERRMRGAVYVEMAKEWLTPSPLRTGVSMSGIAFAAVVESLWLDGMQRKESLLEEAANAVAWAQQEIPPSGGNDINGKGKTKANTAVQIAEKALRKAFANGYLSVVTEGSQASPSALEMKWEADAKEGFKGIPTTKDQKAFRAKVQHSKQDWEINELARSKGRDPGSSNLVSEVVAAGDEEYSDLPNNAFFRINAERFHIRWRDELLQTFARERYNDGVARVFRLVLALASKSLDYLDEGSSRTLSRHEILQAWESLPRERRCDLTEVFGSKPPGELPWDVSRMGQSELLLEILYVLSGLGHDGVDVRTFLVQIGDGTSAKWFIDYERLCDWIKRRLVEAMIEDKLGPLAIRCWRILEVKGRIDEKHLARFAFLSVKDVREVIGRLSDAGLIEPQEVPRSADRAPSRTFYLWCVDYAKVVRTLVDHQYKALGNLQAQKMYRLELHKGLVEKRERADVRKDPGLLTQVERDMSDELDKVMDALTTAERRIDVQLFVLSELDAER